MLPAPCDDLIDGAGNQVFLRSWPPAPGSVRPPIVLLHDSLGSTEQWRDFPPALAMATGRMVVSYDRPGFGKSGVRSDRLAMSFIGDEASGAFALVLDRLGIGEFVVLGHSVGGAMALEIAARHGDRCRGVITEAAQAFVEDRTLAGIRSAKARFAQPEQLERLRKWHGDKHRWVLAAWTDTWLDPGFWSWNLDAALPEVRCPALILHGDRDEFGTAAFPRRIAAGVRGPVDWVLLKNCGHVPHREQPHQVLARVGGFLSNIR